MTTIKIKSQFSKKIKTMIDVINGMDKVKFKVESVGTKLKDPSIVPADPNINFFEIAGLWKDTDITIEKIREKAWPKRQM